MEGTIVGGMEGTIVPSGSIVTFPSIVGPTVAFPAALMNCVGATELALGSKVKSGDMVGARVIFNSTCARHISDWGSDSLRHVVSHGVPSKQFELGLS